MTQDIIKYFNLQESPDGQYAYLKPEIDKEDYVRLVMSYAVLVSKYEHLEKELKKLNDNTRASFIKVKLEMNELSGK